MKLVGVFLLFLVGKSGCWVTNEVLGEGLWKGRISGPPGIVPEQDLIVCEVIPIEELIHEGVDSDTAYATAFHPHTEDDMIHYAQLKYCVEPRFEVQGEPGEYRDFPTYTGQCPFSCKRNTLIFGFGPVAQLGTLPSNVSYALGPELQYLYLQVHYNGTSPPGKPNNTYLDVYFQEEPTEKNAHVILLLPEGNFSIPPGMSSYFIHANCEMKNGEMEMVGYSAQSHGLAKEIRGFKVIKDTWEVKSMSRTKLPSSTLLHLFGPEVKNDLRLNSGEYLTTTLNSGDYLAATCEYSTINKTTVTKLGRNTAEEIFNWHVMVFVRAGQRFEDIRCAGVENPAIKELIEKKLNETAV